MRNNLCIVSEVSPNEREHESIDDGGVSSSLIFAITRKETERTIERENGMSMKARRASVVSRLAAGVAHGRRLACAIRSEQPEHLLTTNRKRDAVNGKHVVEALSEIGCHQEIVGQMRLRFRCGNCINASTAGQRLRQRIAQGQ